MPRPDIASLLMELDSRLPELEWQLGKQGVYIEPHNLPEGLFGTACRTNAAACIAEIRLDMERLALQENQPAALHLAERIRQKIRVLVMACRNKNTGRDKKVQEQKGFHPDALSTRQQWLQSLEKTIKTLTAQKDALVRAMAAKSPAGNQEALLALQAELGQAERRLTLVQEAWDKLS